VRTPVLQHLRGGKRPAILSQLRLSHLHRHPSSNQRVDQQLQSFGHSRDGLRSLNAQLQQGASIKLHRGHQRRPVHNHETGSGPGPRLHGRLQHIGASGAPSEALPKSCRHSCRLHLAVHLLSCLCGHTNHARLRLDCSQRNPCVYRGSQQGGELPA